MSPRAEQLKIELVERIVAIVRERLSGERAARAETFVRTYYANVPPVDMVGQDPETFYGAALSFLQFGQRREAGCANIRVFNPQLQEHGWRSRHTIIEIVTDDMPFLVDSVTGELNRRGLTVHLVIHPILHVGRTKTGSMNALASAAKRGGVAESFIHMEIEEQTSPDMLANLERGIQRVLDDVRAAVEDWPGMRERMLGVIDELKHTPPGLEPGAVAEAIAFLEWIAANHFTFLGYREYDIAGKAGAQEMRVVPGGLGLLRDPERDVFENWRDLAQLPAQVRAFIQAPNLLTITKANTRCTVHRPVQMDVIAIKKFDAHGQVAGERMVVGLFTSAAYSRSPRVIPLLRRKIERVIGQAEFPPASHDGKALAHVLETFPRDELFQSSDDELFANAMGILHLQERQRTALFIRRDPFERFVTALIYVPRERYNSGLRKKFGTILERAFNGAITAYEPHLATDSVLAQVLFYVATEPGKIPPYDVERIETTLIEIARSWTDKLRVALVDAKGEESGLRLYRRFGEGFSAGYEEVTTPVVAVHDIDMAEAACAGGGLSINLYRRIEDGGNVVRLKLYALHEPIALSDVLPMLEHMGLRVLGERPHQLTANDSGKAIWIHDLKMEGRDGAQIDVGAVREAFQAVFARIWSGDVEDDGFNSLVLKAALEWRDIIVVRAYCKYLRQARITFSQEYMEQTLGRNPSLARSIIELFRARFDPARREVATQRAAALRATIENELEDVASLDEDRIIRRFVNLVEATLRTNFFQPAETGAAKPYLSFKLDSALIEDLPSPRPWREIFVYSPRMEGIHLRGGAVARGGLRWSDRREDFSTEVLGLMKAQMVKNAVIVPVGSKGGFVCKRLPVDGDRAAVQTEVVDCYKTLIRGMLDLTDNLAGDAVTPPADVVRLDDDDPYLVVAADKGTATFSDIANQVSAEYGFWLGDAFASGGSAGYDHKKMAITARGAWESVKRHFRELGHDTQSQPFTTVGVGDMAGDVFGNGMLQSQHIRLVGAFNHLHIFVDPDPDAAASFAERKRLFELPRSSWRDFDAAVISEGGGVFDRHAKSIKLTPQIKQRFALDKDKVTPNDLIRAILKAPVDLMWFGGIGTYVKASAESHADVGDRANDAVRIDATELACRVIGEGANLAITQLARIELANQGGCVNSDFIDNSAGVDCSDHEVNIKIVLDGVVADGDMTVKQRNRLLVEMTDEVAKLVLNDNYLQTQAIGLAQARHGEHFDRHWGLMRSLERAGRLDRAIEFLPDDEVMAERKAAGLCLTRPEHAVLFSYAKIVLFDSLLATDLLDDAYLVRDLARYFPTPLQSKYEVQIGRHRLRREIIATYVTNSLVNRVGASFVNDLQDTTGMEVGEVARAYVVARDALGLRPVWRSIEALDNQVQASLQTEMNLAITSLVERCALWLLRNGRHPLDIAESINAFAPGVAELWSQLGEVLAPADRDAAAARAGELRDQNVPRALAERIAGLDVLLSAFDIVRIARASDVPVVDTARVYFAMGARLNVDWLRHAAGRTKTEGDWERRALAAIADDSLAHQAELTTRVLDLAGRGALGKQAVAGLIETWIEAQPGAVARADALFAELKAAPEPELAMLTVANRQLRTLLAAAGSLVSG